MVAYSFKQQFAEPIESRGKRQTVRGFRKRHARPGEPMQLFVAMRTRHCRKILTPDPICLDVRQILIAHGAQQPLFIEIDGASLDRDEIEAFARADGFTDAAAMAAFWQQAHGPQTFAGVVIRWRD